MKYVYVVEHGCYSNRGVVGVYATPEAAMASNPVPEQSDNVVRAGGWKLDDHSEPGSSYSNGCDWEDAMSIMRFELQE